MPLAWTDSQMRRLKELSASQADRQLTFENKDDRRAGFQKLEKALVKSQRQRLSEFFSTHRQPALQRLENRLSDLLIQVGFAQVSTPIIMSRGLMEKMSIDSNHPLSKQIYWLPDDKCLRPMLAPHLYYMLVDLLRICHRPVRIFEIGPCFRKESRGSQHASEFTMLNLVEMGTPEDIRANRIRELGRLITDAAGVTNVSYETETSEVYGDTIDIVAGKDKLEVASAAMGPHPLDQPWRISESWIGIGFGLERLLMAAYQSQNLARFSRSLSYLDGIRLNL